ncbi:MAG: GNAT family N-acetyltransferase [Flavobacterium sp. JAD_PAG50586_2]|nr:MAG: GNAT family N-acetyltransferase [Flavobacterium sp. JAD_PAG50586_2]
MEIIFTKHANWLTKWDQFVTAEDKASHLSLSDWNKSFRSYGFDFEVCILTENEKIYGGFAAVIAKAAIFKFYIVPHGPVIASGNENQLNDLIAKVPERAKHFNCCYGHISLPVSKIENPHTYTSFKNLSLKSAKEGHLFKYVYSSNGLNWIALQGFDEESKMMSLKASSRRNIRYSYRKELELKSLTTKEEIETGYALFQENSNQANYNIREWKDMKETLFSLNEKGNLRILAAYKDNEMKGAILLVKAGNYYTYILGGTKKETPDLGVGDFLQWEAIKLSLESGFDGYNISLGGSKGVVEFKSGFNTEPIYFENSKYHWIVKPFYFKSYLFFEKHLKSHKKTISKVLSILKK